MLNIANFWPIFSLLAWQKTQGDFPLVQIMCCTQ